MCLKHVAADEVHFGILQPQTHSSLDSYTILTVIALHVIFQGPKPEREPGLDCLKDGGQLLNCTHCAIAPVISHAVGGCALSCWRISLDTEEFSRMLVAKWMSQFLQHPNIVASNNGFPSGQRINQYTSLGKTTAHKLSCQKYYSGLFFFGDVTYCYSTVLRLVIILIRLSLPSAT